MRVGHVLERRPLPQDIHEVALVRKCAPFHLLVLVVIRHVVVADQVADARRRDGRFEDVCLGDQPIAQLSTVTGAFHPEAVAVNPKVAAKCGANAVEHVLCLVAVLVGEHRVG